MKLCWFSIGNPDNELALLSVSINTAYSHHLLFLLLFLLKVLAHSYASILLHVKDTISGLLFSFSTCRTHRTIYFQLTKFKFNLYCLLYQKSTSSSNYKKVIAWQCDYMSFCKLLSIFMIYYILQSINIKKKKKGRYQRVSVVLADNVSIIQSLIFNHE